jgi:hypothetical protein
MKYDSLFSNSQRVNYKNQFVQRTFTKINNAYEQWLKKNIKPLIDKDPKVLERIDIPFTSILKGELTGLWNQGFSYGQESLAKFNESTDIAEFLADNLSKDEAASRIKTRSGREKRRTIQYEGRTPIATTEFGQIYLNERNNVIARSFTNEYTRKIRDSISRYIKSDVNVGLTTNKERTLINRLSFKRFTDLTPAERKELLPLLNQRQLSEIQKNVNPDRLKQIKGTYGLKDAIASDPESYDSAFYKINPINRIDRIAQTEINAAYNLGRADRFLSRGVSDFIWRMSGRETCELCTSMDGRLVSLVPDLKSYFFTDFRRVDTKKPAQRQTTHPYPPVHPFCDCFLEPIRNQKDLERLIAAGKTPEDEIERIRNTLQGGVAQQKQGIIKGVVGKAITSFLTQEALLMLNPNTYETLSLYYQLQELKKQQEDQERLKLLFVTTSILSIGLMYYFYLKSHPEYVKEIKERVMSEILEFVPGVKTVEDLISPIAEPEVEATQKAIESPAVQQQVQQQQQLLAARQSAKPLLAELRRELQRLLNMENQFLLINAELTGVARKTNRLMSMIDDPTAGNLIGESDILNNRIIQTIRDVDEMDSLLQEDSPFIRNIQGLFEQVSRAYPTYSLSINGTKYNPNKVFYITQRYKKMNLKVKARQQKRLVDLIRASTEGDANLQRNYPNLALFRKAKILTVKH